MDRPLYLDTRTGRYEPLSILRLLAGFNCRESAAQFFGYSTRQWTRFESGAHPVPKAVILLLQVRAGDLGILSREFHGWTFCAKTGYLVSPCNQLFNAGQVLAITYQQQFIQAARADRRGNRSPAVQPAKPYNPPAPPPPTTGAKKMLRKLIAGAALATLSACASTTPQTTTAIQIYTPAHGAAMTVTGAYSDGVLTVSVDDAPSIQGVMPRSGGTLHGQHAGRSVDAVCTAGERHTGRALYNAAWTGGLSLLHDTGAGRLFCTVAIAGERAVTLTF